MFPVWNYLEICSCFETQFLENQVLNVKLDFFTNGSYSELGQLFHNFFKIFFYVQKSSFKTWAFYYIVSNRGYFVGKFWHKGQMSILAYFTK